MKSKVLKCKKCGNASKFYSNISIQAKLRVNKYGENLKQVFDIEKDIIDNYFDPIYCLKCDEEVQQ